MTGAATSAEAAAALIEGVDDLPTPNFVFTQIVKVVDDPDTSAYEVAAIISEDAAMSAKVLRTTNSAFYGLSGTVTSVKQAVVILGLDTLRSLVIATGAINMFADERIDHGLQDFIWRHSLVTACGSRMLMRSIHPEEIGLTELAFTAGVLHDIGKMVMFLRSPTDYQAIVQQISETPGSRQELEQERYGCDHATVGQCLTMQWQLPEALCCAIGHHHTPGDHDDPHHLTDVLHVANGLAYHILADPHATASAPTIDPSIFERCGLRIEALSDQVEQVKQEYAKAETFLRVAREAA